VLFGRFLQNKRDGNVHVSKTQQEMKMKKPAP
jgi:hypothetical protein